MRDAAGQLPDRVELLVMQDGFLGAFLLAQIVDDADENALVARLRLPDGQVSEKSFRRISAPEARGQCR